MKKILLMCALMPMLVLAQSMEDIYKNLPNIKTEDILTDYNNVISAMSQYRNAQADLKIEIRRINNVLGGALQVVQAYPNILDKEVKDSVEIAKMNRINELCQQIGAVPDEVKVDSFIEIKLQYDEEYAPYEKRAQVIEHELKTRIGKVDSRFGYIETPKYAKEYYDRMNVIADEYNRIYVPKWDEQLLPEINRLTEVLNVDVPAFTEIVSTFETLTDPVAQAKSAQSILQVAKVQQLFKSYLDLCAERLMDAPHMYYKVPDYITGL